MKQQVDELIEEDGRFPILDISPLHASEGPIFIAHNSSQTVAIKCLSGTNAYERLYSEKKGLDYINSHCKNLCPETIGIIQGDSISLIIMEYINSDRHAPGPSKVANTLYKLHCHQNHQFGFHFDNYIGSLLQPNQLTTKWPTFWYTMRIQPLVDYACSQKLLDRDQLPTENQYYKAFQGLQEYPFIPSLIHGDLWNGNLLIDIHGNPRLIDPAPYYGDPMVDIAMMELFGGFSSEVFNAYYQLQKNANKKCIPIYKLYFLLVHLCMFGKAYAGDCHRLFTFIKQF